MLGCGNSSLSKDMYDDGGTEDDPYGEVDPAVKALNKKPLVPPTVTALLVIKALCYALRGFCFRYITALRIGESVNK